MKGSLSLYGFESTAGQLHRNAKLTNEQAAEIYLSNEPLAELAKRYGISVRTIDNIRGKRSWWKTIKPIVDQRRLKT